MKPLLGKIGNKLHHFVINSFFASFQFCFIFPIYLIFFWGGEGRGILMSVFIY